MSRRAQPLQLNHDKIADLAGSELVRLAHLAEALFYRPQTLVWARWVFSQNMSLLGGCMFGNS